MLKMTEIKFKKISYPDKHMFFEQGIRGGISYINNRYSQTSENVNVLYLDMNNLYGCAMSHSINNFEWVQNINKIKEKLTSINKK